MNVPTPQEVRTALADLDARSQKIVAALFGVMVQNPAQVRDREWMARQLAELTVLAGEFRADTPEQGVQVVQRFLEENAEELLRKTLLLFQRVGLDLAPRAAEGFAFDQAMRAALDYLPS